MATSLLLCVVIAPIIIVALACLSRYQEFAEWKERSELAKQIEQFPPDVQVTFWESYYRHQAERDLL